MAAIRLQEFNEFSQSPGGISTWVIAGGLVGLVMAGMAFGMAKRRAIAREQWKQKNMVDINTVVSVQRNPLISTRGIPTNASPQTALQTLQQERTQMTSPNIRRASFNRAPEGIHTISGTSPPLRSMTPKAISIGDHRKDLQVFQATTVRNIRQGRGGTRIHGIRRDII
jgi:hypothetical protein